MQLLRCRKFAVLAASDRRALPVTAYPRLSLPLQFAEACSLFGALEGRSLARPR